MPGKLPISDKTLDAMTIEELSKYIHDGLDRCDLLKMQPDASQAEMAEIEEVIHTLLGLVSRLTILKMHRLDAEVRKSMVSSKLRTLTGKIRDAATRQAALTKQVNDLKSWVDMIAKFVGSALAVVH